MHFKKVTIEDQCRIKKASFEYKNVFKGKTHNAYTYKEVAGEEFAFKIINGKMFIVFDGSSDINEWGSNFRFTLKKTVDIADNVKIRYHKGFYDTHLKMREYLINLVNKNNIHEIEGIGYSRGVPNLAHFLRAANKYCNVEKTSMIGFGSPSIGNRMAIADMYSLVKDVIIVNHYQDLVSSILSEYCGYYQMRGTYNSVINLGNKFAKFFSAFKRVSAHFSYFKNKYYK